MSEWLCEYCDHFNPEDEISCECCGTWSPDTSEGAEEDQDDEVLA